MVREPTIVDLTWSTSSEVSKKDSEVEVSDNTHTHLKPFHLLIAQVKVIQDFSYQHLFINPRAAYYRLRQVDFDGTFSYSPVVFVEGVAGKVVVYPNPNNGTFTVNLLTPEGGITQAKLFNAQGIEVTLTFSPSGLGASISPSGLGAGVYFLHTIVAGKTKITKVVIER